MNTSFDRRNMSRKRSGRVVLTTMAALGGGTLLAGCGEADATGAAAAPAVVASDGDEVEVYQNVFDCAKKTGKTRQECNAMHEEAVAVAKAEAPRFEALADCEQDYGVGRCVEEGEAAAPQERRHFSPFVVAWISSKSNGRAAPLFPAANGGYQTSRGVRLGYANAPGKYFAGSRAFERAKSAPRTKVASAMAKSAATGGFGSTSRGWKVAGSGSGGRSYGG